MNDIQAQQVLKPYPIFRLTFFLVTGIFLSLKFGSEGFGDEVLELLRGVLLVLLCVMGRLLNGSRYASRAVYGGVAFVSMGCLGALLAQERIRAVHYDWPLAPCIYRGVLLERPQETAKTYRCRLRVDAGYPVDSLHSITYLPVHREVWVYVMKDSLTDTGHVGDGCLFYAQVASPSSSRLPGEFDYAAYLFQKGVSGTAVVYSGCWKRTGERESLTWKQQALACREQVLAAYRRWGFQRDEGAILSALTVGYKDELSEDIQTLYRQVGVSHILALSGMHVAVLWGLLAFLFRPIEYFRAGRWLKCFLIVGLLWGFAFLVGLSPSVVRAVVMCMMLMIAKTASSEFSSLNALSVAAAVMLCADPFYLWDVGFQLSFLAVLSILLIYPILFQAWSVRQPLIRYLWSTVSISLAAQLGTLPVILYYFSYFPVYFLLANVWVAPWVCLIIYGAVVLWLVSPFPVVHDWAVEGMNGLLRLMTAGLRPLGRLPLAESGGIQLSLKLVWVLYALWVTLWFLWVYRIRKLWIVLLLVLHVGLGVWFDQLHHPLVPAGLYLSEGRVKAFPQEAMWQCDSLYRYQGITVCQVASDRWQNCGSNTPLQVDYLYLCAGFRGKIASLKPLFKIRQVVLDASLSPFRRQRYEDECRALHLKYIVLKEKGSFQIFP